MKIEIPFELPGATVTLVTSNARGHLTMTVETTEASTLCRYC